VQEEILETIDEIASSDSDSDCELADLAMDEEVPDEDDAQRQEQTGGIDTDGPWHEESHFRASNRWRQQFLRRWRFYLPRPHPKHRPVIDPEERKAFAERILTAVSTLPPMDIVSTDETSWKIVDHGCTTVADRGTEGVSCLFEGDPKACVTAIATISAAGEKLPLWVAAKGKTDRCETNLRSACSRAVDQGRLFVTHQQSGWTTSQVASQHLRWLAETHQRPLLLIWDLFSAHRDSSVQELARNLGIKPEFIPAGATGELQPLDRRIFGNLKQRARRRFDDDVLEGRTRSLQIGPAVCVLLDAWASIEQDEVLDAWEHLRQRQEQTGHLASLFARNSRPARLRE
jgi:hypothetical protein